MSDGYEECSKPNKSGKTNNVLPIWGNEQTMNLNPLILANIQGSSYFKVHLFKLKTYHEVVDEIYYQVRHLEPWERGSRKTAGQTGMCGGVRGVGAGGIVSTAYCLLYKLYTLRLTRKQLNGLLAHPDSPFIRALGFMYIRYTQPPADLMEWLEPYLEDEEALECGGSASSGSPNTIGELARHLLTKLDWFTTLFPRIPVPIQKTIQQRLEEYDRQHVPSKPQKPIQNRNPRENNTSRDIDRDRERDGEFDRDKDDRDRYRSDRDRDSRRDRGDRSERDRHYDRDRDRDRTDTRERDRGRERYHDRGDRDRESSRHYDRSDKDRGRSDRDRYRDRSPAVSSSHRKHR